MKTLLSVSECRLGPDRYNKTLFWNVYSVIQLDAVFPPLLQSLFREWLAEKEEALSEVQTGNFKDPSEMNTNVRRLAVSRVPAPGSCSAAIIAFTVEYNVGC